MSSARGCPLDCRKRGCAVAVAELQDGPGRSAGHECHGRGDARVASGGQQRVAAASHRKAPHGDPAGVDSLQCAGVLDCRLPGGEPLAQGDPSSRVTSAVSTMAIVNASAAKPAAAPAAARRRAYSGTPSRRVRVSRVPSRHRGPERPTCPVGTRSQRSFRRPTESRSPSRPRIARRLARRRSRGWGFQISLSSGAGITKVQRDAHGVVADREHRNDRDALGA